MHPGSPHAASFRSNVYGRPTSWLRRRIVSSVMGSRVLCGEALRGARLAALAVVALLALAAPSPVLATEIVKWPWGATRTFRAPFDMPFKGVGGVAVSPEGNFVYIGTQGVVVQYSSAGLWLQTWTTHFKHVSGMATDPFGDVYVADSAAGVVQKFDQNGKHLASWTVPGVQQIAADAHARLFLLVSVGIGDVVDVRSTAGKDEGAWSAALPGSWFPPGPNSYSLGATASIEAIAVDAAGNVYLAGTSRQRLEGNGPDCHSVFEEGKQYVFTYADPLDSDEVAEYTSNGQVERYGWANSSARACYPGWRSSYPLNAMEAVKPSDGTVWISQSYGTFAETANLVGPGVMSIISDFYSSCFSCEGVYEEPAAFLGPSVFDCHENLFVGSGDRVVEFEGLGAGQCHSRISKHALVTLAPALKIVTAPTKKKKKKSKTLDFQAGCAGQLCKINVTAARRRAHCHGKHCLAVIGHGRFTVASGRVNDLALPLGAGKLGARPRIVLSARLLRHGHPRGRRFFAAGGRPLLARTFLPLKLSCPASVPLGGQIALSGSLGTRGARVLTLEIVGAGPTPTHTIHTNAAGAFAFSPPASSAGRIELALSYAGDRTHSPTGGECGTEVASTPVPPLPPPPPVREETPSEPPPAATSLSLACRTPFSGQFTGALTPPLGGMSITISYEFTLAGNPTVQKQTATVTTASDGTFTDGGPSPGAMGKATASWTGAPGYTGAISPTCEFG
jgi:hypothetical protein